MQLRVRLRLDWQMQMLYTVPGNLCPMLLRPAPPRTQTQHVRIEILHCDRNLKAIQLIWCWDCNVIERKRWVGDDGDVRVDL